MSAQRELRFTIHDLPFPALRLFFLESVIWNLKCRRPGGRLDLTIKNIFAGPRRRCFLPCTLFALRAPSGRDGRGPSNYLHSNWRIARMANPFPFTIYHLPLVAINMRA